MSKRFTVFLCALFVVLSVFADLPFRNHRYDGFKVLHTDTGNIVFIGNSITNMHNWNEAFDNTSIVNRGVSGAVSSEVIGNLESMIAGKPSKVFLMIGTNDLGTAGINTAAHVATNVRHIIKRIRRSLPVTTIYLQGILPSRLRTMSLIDETNAELKKIAEENDVTYVDLRDALISVSQANDNTHTLDGLHLLASGYRIWCKAIAGYVGSDCVYPDTATNQYNGLTGSIAMRVSYFGMLPVRSTDVLFLGDDVVHSGEWSELLQTPNIKNRGNGWGYASVDLVSILKTVPVMLKGQASNEAPAKVIIYAGAKDVNSASDVSTLKPSYLAIVDKIREMAPSTKIILASLLPHVTVANNTRVVAFNSIISSIADSLDNVEFADFYTALASNAAPNATYMSGNYVYGRGYAKLSQVLAPFLADEGAVATTDDEAESRIALFDARTTLGAALLETDNIAIGTGVGAFDSSIVASLQAIADTAYTVLADMSSTIDDITAQTAKLTAALASAKLLVNKPVLSNDTSEVYYTFTSSLRGSRLMASQGAGNGILGEDVSNYARTMWKFTERADGTWNIINRKDSSYISPSATYNTQVLTTVTEPSAGWVVSVAAITGMFIISSGTVQLNQTGSGSSWKIYNWGNGGNTTDLGCQFTISLAGDVEEEPAPPTPILALGNLTLDGARPIKVDDEQAAPVLATTSSTVVIDFTASEAPGTHSLLTASSDTTQSLQYFGAGLSGSSFRLYTVSTESAQGWYTRKGKTFAETRAKIVVTSDSATSSHSYYLDGSYVGNVTYSGTYVYRTFGSVPGVNALYIGGVVTSENSNRDPFKGTIHSIRFYDHVLSSSEIASLDYPDDIVTSANSAVTSASAPSYIVSGRKVMVSPGVKAELFDLIGRRQSLLTVLKGGIYLLRIDGNTYKINLH